MPTYTQAGNNEVAGFTNAAAVPAVFLTSLNPASHARDAVAFTLHALGSGFGAGAVINFDGTDRATTVVGPGEVTASITLTGGAARLVPVTVKSGNGYSTPRDFAVT